MEAETNDVQEHVLSAVGQALIITDRGGGVLWASDNLADVAGHSAESLIMGPITDLVPEDERGDLAEVLRTIATAPGMTAALPIRTGSDHTDVEIRLATSEDRTEAEELVWVVSANGYRAALDQALELLADAAPLPEVCEAVARACVAGTGAVATSVFWERQDRRFTAVAHGGSAVELRDAVDAEVDEATEGDGTDGCAWDLFDRQDLTFVESSTLPERVAAAQRDASARSVHFLPVHLDSGLPAAVVACWLPHELSRLAADQQTVLARTEHMLRLALIHDRDEQRLLDASCRDPLTGLVTRARFHAVVERQARRQPIAVLDVDIDDFTALNAEHGEAIGDEVLVEMARRLEDVVRPSDVVARLGADEFAVVCTQAPPTEVLEAIAGRLLQSLSAPVLTSTGTLAVTVSVGIAMSAEPVAPGVVLDAAEEALTAVKADDSVQSLLVDALA